MILYINEPEIYLTELPYLHSIKINSIYLFADSLCKKASQFVRPVLLFHAEHLDYPGLAGSATLIRHNDTNYAIVTSHQHNHMSGSSARFGYSKLYIASLRDNITSLPFDKIIVPVRQGDDFQQKVDDFQQVTALVISDQEPNAKDYFNHIETRDPAEDQREAICSFIIGYSTLDSTIKYNPTSQPIISLSQLQIGCVRDYSYQLNEDYLHTYNFCDPSPQCLNGCSGGALFSIRKRDFNYQIELDGIILRGGRNKVHIISASLFFDFL